MRYTLQIFYLFTDENVGIYRKNCNMIYIVGSDWLSAFVLIFFDDLFLFLVFSYGKVEKN